MKRPSGTRKVLVGSGLFACSVLLTLAAGELVCRVLPARSPVRLERFVEAVEGHGGNFESAFEGDPELFWRLKPGVVLPEEARPFSGLVSNEQGLREDHLVPLEKPPGEIRLLFLGDSVTFGYLVRPEQCFVELTERSLAKRFPGVGIECINAGVPGYTLLQGLRFLATRGWDWSPDLVVLNFGWNERSQWSGGGDLEHLEALQHARPPRGLRWSRLARLLFSLRLEEEAGEPRLRLTPEEFRSLLEEARQTVRAHRAELLILVGAGRFNLGSSLPANSRNPQQIEQYQVAREITLGPEGSPALVDGVVALRELLSEHTVEEVFFDGVHPTPLGHQQVARALCERLEPWLAARLDEPAPAR